VYSGLWKTYGILVYSSQNIEKALEELQELGYVIREGCKIRLNEEKIGEVRDIVERYVEKLPDGTLSKYIKEKLDTLINLRCRHS